MFILKRIPLTEGGKLGFEQAMRKSSVKRTRTLDLVSTVSDIGSTKFFLGYDEKKNVQFSRLRTSFEKFMPRLIIIMQKSETEMEYRLRYSLLSAIVVIFWALGLIVITATSLVNKYNYDYIIISLFFLASYVLLTLLELKIVDKRIKKAQAQPT